MVNLTPPSCRRTSSIHDRSIDAPPSWRDSTNVRTCATCDAPALSSTFWELTRTGFLMRMSAGFRPALSTAFAIFPLSHEATLWPNTLPTPSRKSLAADATPSYALP